MDRAEEIREYKRKWDAEHIDVRREQWRKGSQRYKEAWKASDPEGFREYNNKASRESHKKNYVPHSEMSEEDLAKRRKQLVEAQKRYRERKKAERLAAEQAKQNGTV